MKDPNTFPYRLAAIDLDDTLLGPDKRISDANFAAIRTLRDLGVRIVLASGRRHENMLPFHRKLDLQGPIISCQGALVQDAETDERIHQQFMPADLAAEVVAAGVERGMTVVYYHTDNVLVGSRNHLTHIYETRTGRAVIDVGDLTQLAGDSPLKVLWLNSVETVEAEFPSIQAFFGDRLETVVTDPEYIEFMAPGVSKAVGVAAVAERFGIAQSEVMSFGDGNNDVAMLRWAGMGVAMSDAKPSAKAAAKRVAPDGDPETCFARAIAELL